MTRIARGAPLYVGDRCVGFVVGRTLQKQARASKHLLRKYPGPGWAADLAALEEAAKAGAVTVEVSDLDTCLLYRATIEAFWTHGVVFERGFGWQICLPMAFWEISAVAVPA